MSSYDPPRLTGTAAAVFLLFLTAASTGCDRPAPSQSSVVSARPAPSFGSDALGFVSVVEANGAFVVHHAFDRDTNGDGALDPQFGDHGEPQGDWPSVWLTPLPSGEAEQFDELVTSDPSGRWVVLRRNDDLVAVSASKRWTLNDADATPDPSPCTAARQASIDPTSTWLTFTRADPPRAVVKNLGTGVEREVPAEGELWRADAMPRGWVMLREVMADSDGNGQVAMPRREGTCICRWCSRFAASVGSGRLTGDESRETMVDSEGRRLAPPATPIPLGPDAIWSMARNQLYGADGQPREFGNRCSMRMLPLGADRIVALCGTKPVIWNALTDTMTPMEADITPLQAYSPPADGWVAVKFTDDSRAVRVGRLNLETGRIEAGPTVLRWGAPHPSGWRLVADEAKLYAWDVATGTTTELEFTGEQLDGLVARRGSEWFVVDPTRSKPAARLNEQPRFVAANGCYVEPHPYNLPVRGPFVWRCN